MQEMKKPKPLVLGKGSSAIVGRVFMTVNATRSLSEPKRGYGSERRHLPPPPSGLGYYILLQNGEYYFVKAGM